MISFEREIEELNNDQDDEEMFNEMEALLKDADISSVRSGEESDDDTIDSESFNTTITEGLDDEEEEEEEEEEDTSRNVEKSTELTRLIQGLETRLSKYEESKDIDSSISSSNSSSNSSQEDEHTELRKQQRSNRSCNHKSKQQQQQQFHDCWAYAIV